MPRRMLPNGTRDDKRGRAKDRQRRKVRLLHTFGDGTTCPCHWCGCELTIDTLQQDRKVPGGSYRFDNLLPSCADCNLARGDQPMEVFRCASGE